MERPDGNRKETSGQFHCFFSLLSVCWCSITRNLPGFLTPWLSSSSRFPLTADVPTCGRKPSEKPANLSDGGLRGLLPATVPPVFELFCPKCRAEYLCHSKFTEECEDITKTRSHLSALLTSMASGHRRFAPPQPCHHSGFVTDFPQCIL